MADPIFDGDPVTPLRLAGDPGLGGFDTTLQRATDKRLDEMGFYRSILQPKWRIGTIGKSDDGDMGMVEVDRLLEQVPEYSHRSCKPSAKWHTCAIQVVGKDIAEAELIAQVVLKALLTSGV